MNHINHEFKKLFIVNCSVNSQSFNLYLEEDRFRILDGKLRLWDSNGEIINIISSDSIFSFDWWQGMNTFVFIECPECLKKQMIDSIDKLKNEKIFFKCKDAKCEGFSSWIQFDEHSHPTIINKQPATEPS